MSTSNSVAKLEKEQLDNALDPLVNDYMVSDTLKVLLTFRFLNALSVITFFQPDEFFQSLEPAWQMAFGKDSGAWITWVSYSHILPEKYHADIEKQEWHHQLRSSLHPAIFAVVYLIFDKPMEFLEFYPQFRGMVLTALPSLLQSICAALGDFYTWRLAEKIYGRGSNTALAAVRRNDFQERNLRN